MPDLSAETLLEYLFDEDFGRRVAAAEAWRELIGRFGDDAPVPRNAAHVLGIHFLNDAAVHHHILRIADRVDREAANRDAQGELF